MTHRDPKTPAPLLLEHLVWDDLSPERRREVEAGLNTIDDLPKRLDALRQDDKETLVKLPAEAVMAEVERRLAALPADRARQPRRRTATARWARAAAACAAVLLTTWGAYHWASAPSTHPTTPAEGDLGTVRLRGEASLTIHRKLPGGTERLKDGHRVNPKDLLRVGYNAAGAPHGVIISVDGRGSVTLHHPDDPNGETVLQTGGAVLLDRAFELDDAPSFERFFLVTSADPMSPAQVVDAGRHLAHKGRDARTAPLALPKDLTQTSLILHKEDPTP